MTTASEFAAKIVQGDADLDRLHSAVNDAPGTFTTDEGVSVRNLRGRLEDIGYKVPVAFASGLEPQDGSFTVIYNGERYAADPADTPFTTTGTFNAAQWLSLSTPSDLITYNQGGTGAIDTTVKAKLQETVSVKDFGAVGDGVTDDTAAIQAALNTQKSVVFPTGEYVISSDLSVYSDTVIDLNGSTLKGDGFLLSGVSNVIIRDGRIENNGTTYPVAMEINSGSNNISLENLTAYQVSEGFRFNGTGSQVQHIRTNNLRVEQCKGTPYFHYNSFNVQHMNISTYNARWGFNMVTGNQHTQVVNAHFSLGASSTTPTGDDSWYDGTPEHGIYCHNSFDCQFVNLHTRGWNRTAGSSGVKIRNFDTFKIDNGIIEDADIGAGFFIQGGGTYNYLRNLVISNVQFKTTTSDIFINDYVLGGDEMEVKFVGCDFPDRQGFNRGAGSAASVLEVNSCNFHLGANFFGGWSGNTVITNCVFHTSTSQALTTGSNAQIDNCTFFDWNTDGNPTGGLPATELLAACISSQNGKNIKILNCNFKQDAKRRVALYGTNSGRLADNQIVNCFGGGDVYTYQSGGASNNYMSNCTNYSNTILPNALTLQSAGNNIKLNDDTTVTTY